MRDFEERRERARALVKRLSPRQTQVLHCLVDGLCNKSIARLLEISPKTVEIHRRHLLMKLGVHSTAEGACIGALAGFGTCPYLDPR